MFFTDEDLRGQNILHVNYCSAIRVRSRINRSLIVFYALGLECLGSIILTVSYRAMAGHVYTSNTIMPRAHNHSMQGQADTHTPSPSWWSA